MVRSYDVYNATFTTDMPHVTDKLYHIMLYLVHTLSRTGFELTTLG